jgi:hypothetical protein
MPFVSCEFYYIPTVNALELWGLRLVQSNYIPSVTRSCTLSFKFLRWSCAWYYNDIPQQPFCFSFYFQLLRSVSYIHWVLYHWKLLKYQICIISNTTNLLLLGYICHKFRVYTWEGVTCKYYIISKVFPWRCSMCTWNLVTVSLFNQ